MQAVQGRIAARKACWFNNLQLSALVFGGFIELLHDPIRCSTSTFVSLQTIEVHLTMQNLLSRLLTSFY